MTDIQDRAIAGVRLVPLTTHPDDRGSVTEIYRRAWLLEAREMVQSNLSMSRARVLRGLHFHRRQADYWCVATGVAFVGLFDLRTGSPTNGVKDEIRIDTAEQRVALFIPKGVAHGFYAETDLVLQYLVDEYFSGSDEFGVAWNDPGLGIAWPDPAPILSDRDRSNPPLTEVLQDAPPYES